MHAELKLTLVAPSAFENILAGMYSDNEILAIPVQNFFYGDYRFSKLAQTVKGTRADLAIHLDPRRSLANLFLHKLSHASVRIGPGKVKYPFDNITLEMSRRSNTLSSYQRIAGLFDDSGFKPEKTRLEITPNNDHRLEIAKELSRLMNLSKNKLLHIIWDTDEKLKNIQIKILSNLIAHSFGGAKPRPRIILGSLQKDGVKENVPTTFLEKIPCFKNLSYGKMIALIHHSHQVVGLNTLVLHLASLCKKKIYMIFTRADAPYDSSEILENVKVTYFKSLKEVDLYTVFEDKASG